MSHSHLKADAGDQDEIVRLRSELRRAELRLEGLRTQLEQRLATIRELRELVGADADIVAGTLGRAKDVEARYQAILHSRAYRIAERSARYYRTATGRMIKLRHR